MILKSQVEWALHCCAILAGLPAGRYLSTKALAEFHGLPKEYLSKALQSLSQAGLVDTTLGPSGGYRLARPPAELTFLEIVEAVEGKSRTFVCTNIREKQSVPSAGLLRKRPLRGVSHHVGSRRGLACKIAQRQAFRSHRGLGAGDSSRTLEEQL